MMLPFDRTTTLATSNSSRNTGTSQYFLRATMNRKNCRRNFISRSDCLIRIECIAVVEQQVLILLTLVQHAVADDKQVDFAAHEAAEGVLGRMGDRLAAHVEARIDQHRAAG